MKNRFLQLSLSGLHEDAKMPLPPVVVCYSALPYRDSMFHATVHLIGSGVGATPWRLASVLDPINRAANQQLRSTDLRSLVPKKSLRSIRYIEFLDTCMEH